ncbi:MAG TPA: hypothetical protein VLF95_12510 [Vicinamibacteria bacterium]|nr:hypothetical protein [Vicinamibacteria bacterium]
MTDGFGHWRRSLIVAYLITGVAVLAVLAAGADFYRTPLLERAHHEGYWQWKAGGSTGHKLGMTGASMMVLMLLYSVRKRVGALRRLGPLGRWLDVHIYLGVFGPLLVVLHSTFKVQGLVALSFWSMVVVALSGVLGRYLYLQIPRTRAGEELALAELETEDRELSSQLRARFRLDEAQLAKLDALVAIPERTGLLGGFVRLVTDDLRLRLGLRRFAASCRSVPRPFVREFERVARQKANVRRRILLWDRVHELFHYWHVLHKPFALVMYLFMAVHVAVALVTGYGGVSLP